MKIRKLQKEDVEGVTLLIFNTFKKFNSEDYFEKEGVQRYLDMYDIKKNTPEELYKKFRKSSFFYVATEGERIIGIIRGNPEKISNLYVSGSCHKRGVGRKLVNKFEFVAKKEGAKKIKVNASLYAVPFYEKVGYKKTTGIRNLKGIKVWPMKKII